MHDESRPEPPRVAVGLDSPELTVFTVASDATPAQALEAFSRFIREGQTRLSLWDLRAADVGSVSSGQVREVATGFMRLRRPPEDARTAFVVSRESHYGILQLVVLLGELCGYPVSMRVFRDYAGATAWLHSPEP